MADDRANDDKIDLIHGGSKALNPKHKVSTSKNMGPLCNCNILSESCRTCMTKGLMKVHPPVAAGAGVLFMPLLNKVRPWGSAALDTMVSSAESSRLASSEAAGMSLAP